VKNEKICYPQSSIFHFSLFILHFPHFSFFIIHLLDPIEKALLKQRLANLPAAKNSYIEKQKKALAK